MKVHVSKKITQKNNRSYFHTKSLDNRKKELIEDQSLDSITDHKGIFVDVKVK